MSHRCDCFVHSCALKEVRESGLLAKYVHTHGECVSNSQWLTHIQFMHKQARQVNNYVQFGRYMECAPVECIKTAGVSPQTLYVQHV